MYSNINAHHIDTHRKNKSLKKHFVTNIWMIEVHLILSTTFTDIFHHRHKNSKY